MKIKLSLLAALTVAASALMPAGAEVPAGLTELFRERMAELGRNRMMAGECSDTIAPCQVRAAQSAVWSAWQLANRHFHEEKLPEPGPIDSPATGSWHLPANLEPDAVMPFYFGVKGDTIAVGKCPLFVYLHGSGPKSHEWATGLKLAQLFDDAPSAYFIPQIPNEGEYYRWWQRSKQFAWERLLRQALASGEFDADRIYLFGISEGGYGSQRLASFYADYLAGAGPMAGGEPLRNAPAENLRNTAFSLLTGDRDLGFYRNELSARVAHELDSLRELYPGDFVHRVELIPGMGHAIDYRPTTPWLKQFSRNPWPHHVSWENFEMDGRYRSGFYNLLVDERSNASADSRTRYDLDIYGQRIDLRVDTVTYRTTVTDPRWGIPLYFERTYGRADKGRVTIFLNSELVNLEEPVEVTVNGRKVFEGRLPLTLSNLMRSCEAFYDPRRLFPASITVSI